MFKIAIIGGGAAGLACATQLKDIGQVFVFEKLEKCGKKILASGNGRCNLTNRNLDISFYNTKHKLVERVLNEFDIDAFFSKLGLVLLNQGELVYPFSNQAKTVQNVLLKNNQHCTFIYEEVIKIDKRTQDYQIKTNAQTYLFDYVVVAIGSNASLISKGGSYKLLEDLNIQMTDMYPSLVQFETKQIYKKLQGVRVKAKVHLVIDGIRLQSRIGEVQFTNYGLSGICIMQLSRFYPSYKNQSVSIEIDLLEGVNEPYEFISKRKALFNEEYLDGLFNENIIEVIKENHLDPVVLSFDVAGLRDVTNAQVIHGGVVLDQLNENFELKNYSNMFIVGEVLDVDGDCGGYNLHFAFGSGVIVGNYIKGDRYVTNK